jgi:hypothetical protein
MALKFLNEGYGYGQVELNNVFFRREGAIEAQCALNPDEFAAEGKATADLIYAENGMLLAVDKANGYVRLPKDEDETLPVALNYSTEHMYDERKKNLGSFYLPAGTFYPRMGYIKKGEVWTTNCLAYDDGEFADDEALKTALKDWKKTPVYGTYCSLGATKLTKTKPNGFALQVAKYYTMPNGAPGVKFQVIEA